MNKIEIVCRAIILNRKTKKLLLVRNKNENFWYPPGGKLEKGEKLTDCVIREVKEETSINVILDRLFYIQQFPIVPEKTNLEFFWLAYSVGDTNLPKSHIDIGGIVEECKWFSMSEIQELIIFPQKLKKQFWTDVKILSLIPNLFIT